MSKIKPILNRLAVVFLALQILNLSIYNTDFYDHTTYHRLKEQVHTPDPIDCLAEMVIEDVAGVTNAFPETNQKESKQKGDLKSNLSFKLIREHKFAEIIYEQDSIYSLCKKEFSCFRNDYAYLFYEEINHPPA